MHLGLVETGYDDQKIKTKMQESGTVKQASHCYASCHQTAQHTVRSKDLARCHEMQQAMYRGALSAFPEVVVAIQHLLQSPAVRLLHAGLICQSLCLVCRLQRS